MGASTRTGPRGVHGQRGFVWERACRVCGGDFTTTKTAQVYCQTKSCELVRLERQHQRQRERKRLRAHVMLDPEFAGGLPAIRQVVRMAVTVRAHDDRDLVRRVVATASQARGRHRRPAALRLAAVSLAWAMGFPQLDDEPEELPR